MKYVIIALIINGEIQFIIWNFWEMQIISLIIVICGFIANVINQDYLCKKREEN